ncbi:MAG: hydantoinase/oxoprolinase family protein [Thermoleophilia bacterium]|nr:hydantoinase/oxoprolinase family protein [Thermoleophilia bacterium]
MAILGIDVGGTFTDAVLLHEGSLYTAKVPTQQAQEDSVIEAALDVLHQAGMPCVERFTHGTTVATNALLERKGARTAFVCTDGFEHILHLRRQNRAHLYRLDAAHAEPLVPLERCFGVRERIGPDRTLVPLDLDSLPWFDAEAIAVCLLFSFRDPSHEMAVVDEVRRRHPGAHVVASHEVAPEFREYERASTTVADAYLGPIAARYLRSLGAAAVTAGLPEPLVMRSSGGVASIDEAAAHPAVILVSGPAAGVVGAERIAALAGCENAIAFDMGGTSTDVCLIAGGKAGRSQGREVAGFPVRLPMVDIHTVGAGGGSIVWRDAGGALRVGPGSAGATPGPACYGRGGLEATVTDANLLLGRLPLDLPGGLALDVDAASRALAGIDPQAVVDVVNAEMLRALRVVSVERGHDPVDFALVAFGGAGPLHACALADELGCRTVLVPEAAGVLSALGLVASDERRDHVRSLVQPLAEAGELPVEGEASLRYAGQSFELAVALGDGLAERFHAAHEERYGYADRERMIELVALRTAETRPGPEILLARAERLSVSVAGPQLVELAGASCWVPGDWAGTTDGQGTFVLRRQP